MRKLTKSLVFVGALSLSTSAMAIECVGSYLMYEAQVPGQPNLGALTDLVIGHPVPVSNYTTATFGALDASGKVGSLSTNFSNQGHDPGIMATGSRGTWKPLNDAKISAVSFTLRITPNPFGGGEFDNGLVAVGRIDYSLQFSTNCNEIKKGTLSIHEFGAGGNPYSLAGCPAEGPAPVFGDPCSTFPSVNVVGRRIGP